MLQACSCWWSTWLPLFGSHLVPFSLAAPTRNQPIGFDDFGCSVGPVSFVDGVMRYLATVHGVVDDHHAATSYLDPGGSWLGVFAWGIFRRRVLSQFERTLAEGAMGASKASKAH